MYFWSCCIHQNHLILDIFVLITISQLSLLASQEFTVSCGFCTLELDSQIAMSQSPSVSDSDISSALHFISMYSQHEPSMFWQILNCPCNRPTCINSLSSEVNFPRKSYKVRHRKERKKLFVFVFKSDQKIKFAGLCLQFVSFSILHSSSVVSKGTGVSIYSRFTFISLVFTSSLLRFTFATC